MNIQNQISKTLKQPEAIKQIKELLAPGDLNRTKLADMICDFFKFIDPRGKRQRAGCLKALRGIESRGEITLPPTCNNFSTVSTSFPEEVPQPSMLPESVEKIENLELFLVETKQEMAIWKGIMFREHPQKDCPLVGRQLRYLVKSEHGWLGGFGFGSAALQLEDRDEWIGWDRECHDKNLHQIVNMSRFLIRNSINCKNLASKLLSMIIPRFTNDFQSRYGYSPLLLESFVDTTHFNGTCYRAANWHKIGHTKGRGRQDRFNLKAKTVKDIYIFSLENNFREKLGLSKIAGLGALSISDSSNEGWAEKEFGNAPVGDGRLSKRLVKVGLDSYENPEQTYNGAAKGDKAKSKSYYRMMQQPEDSPLTVKNILYPHRIQTIRRMKNEKVVLCINDQTKLNYNNLDQCEGLGTIGSNQTGAKSRGLVLHSTFVVNTDGLPLGILRGEVIAPQPKKDKRPAVKIPIEEKKSFYWLKSMRDCQQVKEQMPHTSVINVIDREGDFFELFDDQRNKCPNIDLLVRAKHNRMTAEKVKMFEHVRSSPIKETLTIKVPRKSTRRKKSRQKAYQGRKERIANVEMRYIKIDLKAPSHCIGKKNISLWLVHIREDNPPDGIDPIEWFLLTTIDIKSTKDALNCIKWYSSRWRIEDYHRVLKSGCNVEKLANKTATRLKRAIAIKMVVAWKIMLMTLLGRTAPNLPANVIFSDLEIKVLNMFAQKKTNSSDQHCYSS